MLKFKLKKDEHDKLEESLQALYKQDGENYVLDVEGAVDKSKLDEFRENNIDLRNKMSAFKDVDLEKYKDFLSKEQKLKDKELIDAGEIDKLIEQKISVIKSDYEAKLSSVSEKLKDSESRYIGELSKSKIEGAAMKAFAENNISKDAYTALMTQVKSTFTLDGENVVAKDGDKILTGKNGNLTISEFIAGQPEIFKEKNSGGLGNGSNGGDGSSTGKTAAEKIASGLDSK